MKQQRIFLGVGFALGVLLGILFLFWIVTFHKPPHLPRANFFERFICQEDTQYSSGFDERIFQNIAIGTFIGDVDSQLGIPLLMTIYDENYNPLVCELRFLSDTWHPEQREMPSGNSQKWHEVRYAYTCPGSRSDHFFIRELVMDGNGKVIKKICDFYFD